tara:strand:- start:177 stop:407 length:231 start_codon:yes stop_codon:yes gene_type:complete
VVVEEELKLDLVHCTLVYLEEVAVVHHLTGVRVLLVDLLVQVIHLLYHHHKDSMVEQMVPGRQLLLMQVEVVAQVA